MLWNGGMAKKNRDSIEGSIEHAFRPGEFIDYRQSHSFVEGLETVKAEIDRLIKRNPRDAVVYLETFIAACYEKANEIDDSSGSLGMFVGDLFCTWIKARQAAKADPHETVRQLLKSMSDDDYGFCYEIEKDAVKVFNKAGLRVFAEVAHDEWAKELAQVQAREKGDKMTPGSFRLRWLSVVLRAIYAQQRDAGQYLALAEEMGLTPKDCEALAEIHEKKDDPETALSWVDRGIELEQQGQRPNAPGWGLPERKRRLLKQLGRGADALESAWDEFRKHPSKYGYETLNKYVPDASRAEWYAKVLAVAERVDLSERLELYVELKEWERLVEVVRNATSKALEGLSHYCTEPAAKQLESRDREAAAKLYRALGLRILNSGKSKYYDAALDHFDRARRCIEKAGLAKEWDSLVSRVRSDHSRKTGFLARFEALVSHGAVPKEPSFLERARKRRATRFRTT